MRQASAIFYNWSLLIRFFDAWQGLTYLRTSTKRLSTVLTTVPICLLSTSAKVLGESGQGTGPVWGQVDGQDGVDNKHLYWLEFRLYWRIVSSPQPGLAGL